MSWWHIDMDDDIVRILTDDENEDLDMAIGEYMAMYGIDKFVNYVNWGTTIDGYQFVDVEFYTPRRWSRSQ